MENAAAEITVDAVIVHRDSDDTASVLLVRRRQPVAGQLALPGGFVDTGETPHEAIYRETWEEVGLDLPWQLKLAACSGEPGTTPHDNAVKLVFAVYLDEKVAPVAGCETMGAEWLPIMGIGDRLAFDHGDLLVKAMAAMPPGHSPKRSAK